MRAAAREAAGDAVDIGKLSRQLQRGSIQQRVDAANALAAAGADAAEVLGYAVETDSMVVVRQAAVDALRRMGTAARKALPALRRYANTQAIANPAAGPDEVRVEMMESDMRGVIRDIIRRLN